MGLELLLAGDHSTRRYHRLRNELPDGDAVVKLTTAGRARRTLRLRFRRGGKGGRAMLFRMAPGGKRVRLMRLIFLVPARRVAALYAEFLRRLKSLDVVECPTIVFSSQWGLPVLSHSSSTAADRNARLRAFYLERSLSAGGGGGS